MWTNAFGRPSPPVKLRVAPDSTSAQNGLLERRREELLIELGTIGFEAVPRDPIERGRQVYETLRQSLRDKICTNQQLRRMAELDDPTPQVLAALTDLVASVTHGLPAATLAALLIQDGLPAYCRDRWE
jgi:hypothetical protein